MVNIELYVHTTQKNINSKMTNTPQSGIDLWERFRAEHTPVITEVRYDAVEPNDVIEAFPTRQIHIRGCIDCGRTLGNTETECGCEKMETEE